MAQAASVIFAAGELARITPLSPAAKAIGTAMGIVACLAGLWLVMAHQSQTRSGEETSIVHGLRWRVPVALTVALIGILVVVGAWINPVVHGIVFVIVWLTVLVLTSMTLVFAGVDTWQVSRRATQKRWELVQERREKLREEVNQLRHRFGTNGHSNGNGNADS